MITKRHDLAMTACLMFLILRACAGLAAAAPSATIYGYIKLDASFDQARTNDGNYAYLVLNEKKDDEFNMTANQTRLGLKIQGNDDGHLQVFGQIEFDFYGGGPENKSNPMMRHAFMELRCPRLNLLAGQTWDLFAPLNPATLNYIVLGRSGNAGYRRPQIRLIKDLNLNDHSSLNLALSANRTMGNKEGEGEDSGVPAEMGRLGFSYRFFGQKFAILGVSGLWGRETSSVFQEDFQTQALAIDLSVPLGESLSFQGEYFCGQNMTSYMAGIGQGIDAQNRDEIETSGGWGQISFQLNEAAKMNVGAGFEDPEISPEDISNTKDKNSTLFANIIWTLHPAVSMGVEYMGMETKYRGEESYSNHRGQISFQYQF